MRSPSRSAPLPPAALIAAAAALLAPSGVGADPPACEIDKLLASDGATDLFLGVSVAVDGNVALVGASGDDDNGPHAGAAYVFRFDGSGWAQEQKLLAPDGAPFDFFGSPVAVSGDVAVVGAAGDDDNGDSSGAAYVFRFNGSGWVQEQKLLAPDGAPGDLFGISVAVSGDVAAAGAPGDADNGDLSGSAHVFRFDGSGWMHEQKLVACGPGDELGSSVALDGDVALIGATADDDNGPSSGSAYVLRFNGSSWAQEQKLLAPDGAPQDFFGFSVAVSGDVAVVGALTDDNGYDSGSAYVFRFDGSGWVQEQKLLASDAAAGDGLGFSVSVSGDVAVVGALFDGDNGVNAGSAYVFRFEGSEWVQEQKLLASDGVAGDEFGFAVSVSGDVAVAGALLDNHGGFSDVGSAYTFGGLAGLDCNSNGEADLCEILSGQAEDENGNGIPDECECFQVITESTECTGTSGTFNHHVVGINTCTNSPITFDFVGSGGAIGEPMCFKVSLFDNNGDLCCNAALCTIVPDCTPSTGPCGLDGDQVVGVTDMLLLLSAWGSNPGGPPDFDGNGDVGILDFLALLVNWGPCA